MEELYFFYQEYLDAVRLYLFYQDSKFSVSTGHKSKIEADRYLYLAHYNWEKAVTKARKLVAK
jgi:hypothetical protein